MTDYPEKPKRKQHAASGRMFSTCLTLPLLAVVIVVVVAGIMAVLLKDNIRVHSTVLVVKNFDFLTPSRGEETLAVAQTTTETTPPTSTPTPDNSPCVWNWATQTLPELTAEIQTVLDSLDMAGVKIGASAYGENCFNSDGSIRYFAEMETDFDVTIVVDDINDDAALGERVLQAATVLAAFPPDKTPGPQPGYVTFILTAGDQQRRLHVTYTEMMNAFQDTGTGFVARLAEPQ